jgi:hypothetical protein
MAQRARSGMHFNDESSRFLMSLLSAAAPPNAQAFERLLRFLEPGTMRVSTRQDRLLSAMAEYIGANAARDSRGRLALTDSDMFRLRRIARETGGADLSGVPVREPLPLEDPRAEMRRVLLPRLHQAARDGEPLGQAVDGFLDAHMRSPDIRRRLSEAVSGSLVPMLRDEAPELLVPYLLDTEFRGARVARASAEFVRANLGLGALGGYLSACASGDSRMSGFILESARVQEAVSRGDVISFLRRYSAFSQRYALTLEPGARERLRRELLGLRRREMVSLYRELVRVVGPHFLTTEQQWARSHYRQALSSLEEAISDLGYPDHMHLSSGLSHLGRFLEELRLLDRQVHSIKGPPAGPHDSLTRWMRRRDFLLRTALCSLAGFAAGAAAGAGSGGLLQRLLAVPAGTAGSLATDYLLTGNRPAAEAIRGNLMKGALSAVFHDQISAVLGFRLW